MERFQFLKPSSTAFLKYYVLLYSPLHSVKIVMKIEAIIKVKRHNDICSDVLLRPVCLAFQELIICLNFRLEMRLQILTMFYVGLLTCNTSIDGLVHVLVIN